MNNVKRETWNVKRPQKMFLYFLRDCKCWTFDLTTHCMRCEFKNQREKGRCKTWKVKRDKRQAEGARRRGNGMLDVKREMWKVACDKNAFTSFVLKGLCFPWRIQHMLQSYRIILPHIVPSRNSEHLPWNRGSDLALSAYQLCGRGFHLTRVPCRPTGSVRGCELDQTPRVCPNRFQK